MNQQNITIIGLQWGDEGKGKVVDHFCRQAEIVVRYGGGANAGHTVVTDKGKFVLHLLPTGILHPDIQCLIGPGVVCDPVGFMEELDSFSKQGIVYTGRLFIDYSTHLVLPQHKALDRHAESLDSAKAIATTLRGIGPAYSDKAERVGLTAGDLLDSRRLRQRIENYIMHKRPQLVALNERQLLDGDYLFDYLVPFADRFVNSIGDVTAKLKEALAAQKRILFEGAQGALLDLGLGTYPFVTSSSTTIGGVFSGLGVPPSSQGEILGVVKAYTTRVGNGPFPTELDDETGRNLRDKGGEYGATTGRPRRTGWLDLAVVNRAAYMTGATGIILTKLDVLDGFAKINICVAHEIEEKSNKFPPLHGTFIEKAKPVYQTLEGWSQPTSGLTDYDRLPLQAKAYIEFIEEYLDLPVRHISTGSHTSSLIKKP